MERKYVMYHNGIKVDVAVPVQQHVVMLVPLVVVGVQLPVLVYVLRLVVLTAQQHVVQFVLQLVLDVHQHVILVVLLQQKHRKRKRNKNDI